MTLSAAEVEAIVSDAADGGASSTRSRWAADLRRMLGALPDFEFQLRRSTPLKTLCAAGAHYGWRELETNIPGGSLATLSAKAKASLRKNLQRDLEWITRPCFRLEWTSFGLAMTSIGLPPGQRDPKEVEKMFLRDRPSHRLFSLFRKFPVLARLWCQSMRQWQTHVEEVLFRFGQDRRSLSRAFFSNRRIDKIVDAQFGLSDRHHSGRTVVRLQFESGSIIYKPRSGAGEWEWFSLLRWMNRRGFEPRLRTALVLPRKGYSWMEDIEPAPLKEKPAARRYYERMGGIIAAAYLCKAVDCHRDNLIASGEEPVLVDTDALWHVSALSKTQSGADVLHRTGFLPTENPRGLQSRSSVLGPGGFGNHLPRLDGTPLKADAYQRQIARGFSQAWSCILGTRKSRAEFARRLRRIRSRKRRWIYWATEKYAAIREASIQPSVLRSGAEHELLIRRLCARDIVPAAVIEAEVLALKQLDIPYFERTTNERPPSDKLPIPGELIETIRSALPDPREALG